MSMSTTTRAVMNVLNDQGPYTGGPSSCAPAAATTKFPA